MCVCVEEKKKEKSHEKGKVDSKNPFHYKPYDYT